MTTRFHMNAVEARVSEDVTLVHFADRAQAPQHYILLQRANMLTEQDEALGLDQPHIEIDDQRRSGYGGIVAVEVSPGSVLLRLSPKRAASLGTDEEVLVEFSLADDGWRSLVEAFEDIWADAPSVVAVTDQAPRRPDPE